MSEYRMVSDPLFVGLTRPNLILGVSLKFAMLNMLVSAIGFIQTTNFRILILAVILHGIGYILCLKEPRFLELYIMKFSKCNNCPNNTHYGANSYIV